MSSSMALLTVEILILRGIEISRREKDIEKVCYRIEISSVSNYLLLEEKKRRRARKIEGEWESLRRYKESIEVSDARACN